MKYKITWTETRKFECSLTVEANSEDEAYDKVADTDECDTEKEIDHSSNFIAYESIEELG